MHESDDDFEPEFAVVPDGEELMLEDVDASGGRLRRPAIGVTAGSFNNMIVIPRMEANPLLRAMHAEPLPFGGFVGNYQGQNIELHHLDMMTPVLERYWPDVPDFIYGPTYMLEAVLKEVGIEPASLPSDFMDPFERGLARYAIYTS